MSKRVDMTGKQFGTLTVLKIDEERHKQDVELHEEMACFCNRQTKIY